MTRINKKSNIPTKSFLLAVFSVFGFWGIICSPLEAQAKEINQENVVYLVNQSRAEQNLKPLLINPELSKIAEDKAYDMVKNRYFAHTSPTGITPWYWFKQNNYNYKYAGENLAINYDDAEEEHLAWMNSPTHKRNILNSNFTEIGIATAVGVIEGKKSQVTVQIFAAPQTNIIAQAQNLSLSKKSTYILGAQTDGIKIEKTYLDNLNLKKENPLYEVIDANNKILSVAKSQSDKVVWTIAVLVLLMFFRDMVLDNIYTRKIRHKYSMANLIIFLLLFYILF